jgi:hypothetical protein
MLTLHATALLPVSGAAKRNMKVSRPVDDLLGLLDADGA